ncbi:glycosyltransferase family 2 protein [Aliikangiella coralliicola]|uniref:Glycosyltransferase family 2 protein n=1 Tax=Aliikangiella coralliicola TaxID=2592383 RepID=A0A545UEF1_9GAMM|nr:glycosyltransferase family 2 protein [Aliikangiella coralliicola]TQV87860.1 glycosyltransferase family 2 protein [Aliikangiella coralliicola]
MTQYSACFIIPNYNHTAVFEPMLKELGDFNIPIIVVNDGSDEHTTQLLKKIGESNEAITVLHLPENQGKGGAVMAGMRHAFNQGFSHALQVDADGQHNLEDIQKFLECSERFPRDTICGYPVYDKSVPLGRLLPRYITHFWVWVETLSFEIKDSMCGFRVYPLASCIEIIENNKLGKRMDFDVEILVRLYWESVDIKFIPTKVIYPEDGVSHFQLFRDNWLISKMHTRLFFGMLRRFPSLLVRKFRSEKQSKMRVKHWGAEKEKGSLHGLNFLIWVYKVFGRNIFLILLHPVISYFVLTSKVARESSRTYLQQLAKYQGEPTDVKLRQIYQHFYQFGVSAIDKIACWMGDLDESEIKVHGKDLFEKVAASGKGAVFIGSHLGNLELCRAVGVKNNELKINAIVFNKHASKFQQALSKSNPNVEVNLIHVEKISIDTAILLKQKVEQGEVVIIVGDRTSVSSIGRVQYVDFLGKKAPFAEGPHILAGILECPVYLLFCIKEQGVHNIYLEHFADSLKFSRSTRKQELEGVVQKFAQRLTYYCKKAPLQWFNFYDFWQADNSKEVQRKFE